MDAGIEYDRFEAGRHLNYWAVDRTLQRELQRVLDDQEFDWAEPRLSVSGELIGYTVADNADYVGDHGPKLETYDAVGDVQNFVRCPAKQFETERAVYESGIVADVFEPPPGREEPLPFSQYLGMLQPLSYAEGGGFASPVAMTADAALVLDRFDDGNLDAYYHGLVSREYDDVIEGAMFLTEEQGGSDVGVIETAGDSYDGDRYAGDRYREHRYAGDRTTEVTGRNVDEPSRTRRWSYSPTTTGFQAKLAST